MTPLPIDWARRVPAVDEMYRQLDASAIDVYFLLGSLQGLGGRKSVFGRTHIEPGKSVGCGTTNERIEITMDPAAWASWSGVPDDQRPFGGDIIAHEMSHAYDYAYLGLYRTWNEESRAWAFANMVREVYGVDPIRP